MKTGFDEIDQIIGELPKGITVLGGGAGSGKTAFALDIVCNGLKHDQVCLFFTLELSNRQVIHFINNKENGINADQFINRSLFVDDSYGINVSDILIKAKEVREKCGRLDLIVIDYLQLLQSNESIVNQAENIHNVMEELSAIGEALDVPILVISQISRGCFLHDHEATLSGLWNLHIERKNVDRVILLDNPNCVIYYYTAHGGCCEGGPYIKNPIVYFKLYFFDNVCVKRVKLKLIETKGKFIAADLDDGQVLLKDTYDADTEDNACFSSY